MSTCFAHHAQQPKNVAQSKTNIFIKKQKVTRCHNKICEYLLLQPVFYQIFWFSFEFIHNICIFNVAHLHNYASKTLYVQKPSDIVERGVQLNVSRRHATQTRTYMRAGDTIFFFLTKKGINSNTNKQIKIILKWVFNKILYTQQNYISMQSHRNKTCTCINNFFFCFFFKQSKQQSTCFLFFFVFLCFFLKLRNCVFG